ncbi:MAG: carbohydrate-binding protein, partial [Microbacteriaceae bacterium]|nr:carbohydrate-binding protein [Burkholderiaceae bacterium]
MSNAVSALRAIGDADWPDLVARSSTLMRLMLTCPLFEAEQTVTRDQTLHAIEQLAWRSGHGEAAVAQVLLQLMRCDLGSDHPGATARHWLRGDGRPAMVAQLGLREPLAVVGRALARRGVLPAYLATLGLGTLGLVAVVLGRPGDDVFGWALVALLMLFPASEAVVALVNRLISESARPDPLPRLALVDGIPPEHRVMVVVPAMLISATSIQALVRRLHLHYLANPEPQAQFALPTDWADADAAEIASDAPWLELATREITALNTRHPRPATAEGGAVAVAVAGAAGAVAGAAPADATNAAPRFLLLHRSRRYCQTEQRWIGWERKRGKLEQLVAALAEGRSNAFHDLGEASRIAPGTCYLLTLDSDTQLPPGRLRELVGVAAHPHNQPRLAADGRSLASGYGILQPRVVTPLPALHDATRFHWLFAGQCGVDPYSAATSEVYQDLFDEGSFSGKGLLVVSAMQAVLANRLPENQVLGHDLLEGALVHCATVTDITVVEDTPFHADVAAARLHRWTRGDWQLLPLLLQPRRLPLGAINRWKLFDNLRRSLVAPVSLTLLALALAGAALSPLAALGLVLVALTAGPVLGAVAGLSPSRDDLAKQHFYSHAGADLLRTVIGGLWGLQQLGQQTLMAGDAIGRTLWRLTVSRRHLLQWTPFAATQAQARSDLATMLSRHWHSPALALITGGALLALDTPHPVLTVVLCGLWASAPLGAWWVSRPQPSRCDGPLPAADQAWLSDLARDTWRYYERSVSAADRHLPPDNLQILPQEMLARRTSPTNIGLYLLSAACAREFGWIGTQDLLARLEATLDTLDTLPRHRGHFMNWTDTSNGAPLLPTYVSTVDSGNLCGHLLAVAQACASLANAPFDAGASTQALNAAHRRVLALLPGRHGAPAAREALRDALADHRATRRSAALDDAARAMPGHTGVGRGVDGGQDGAVDSAVDTAAQRLRALVQRC